MSNGSYYEETKDAAQLKTKIEIGLLGQPSKSGLIPYPSPYKP
jgi:hypothetical protein